MNKHESAWAGSGKWRWCVIECRNAGRYGNVVEMGCKWGFFFSLSPSNAQQDTLSADIKQPGLWGFFSEQEAFAVQLIYREKLCWRCWPLIRVGGKTKWGEVIIIRTITDKAYWVHISSLTHAEHTSCLLEMQQEAVGNAYYVTDDKLKTRITAASACQYVHRTNPLASQASSTEISTATICALLYESPEPFRWHFQFGHKGISLSLH